MLEQSDLQQIKKLFDESFQENFDKAFDRKFPSAFGKAFEDAVIRLINPSFEDVYNRLTKLESKVGSLEVKVNQMKGDMVTIDYFDRRMADLKGDTISRERKIDEKANIATDSLKTQ